MDGVVSRLSSASSRLLTSSVQAYNRILKPNQNLHSPGHPRWLDILRFVASPDKFPPKPWPSQVNTTKFPPPVLTEETGDLRVTFVGHSTVLLQSHSLNIVTDPHFSRNAGPGGVLGSERVHEPGVKYDDMPQVHLILLSHDHWDHFDTETITNFHMRDRSVVYTGTGMTHHLNPIWYFLPMLFGKDMDRIRDVQTMKWYDTIRFDSIDVTFLPAQHWSGRYLLDANWTLWGSFLVRTPSHTIYFAGDTAYGPHFKEARALLEEWGDDGVDLALLPIGSYEPRWFMKTLHMNPEEAVRAHLDLGSRQSVAIHFDCFPLAAEEFGQARRDLQIALEKHQVEPEAFVTLEPGEELIVPDACPEETAMLYADDPTKQGWQPGLLGGDKRYGKRLRGRLPESGDSDDRPAAPLDGEFPSHYYDDEKKDRPASERGKDGQSGQESDRGGRAGDMQDGERTAGAAVG
ncbi:unnamed protein product [Vitrella brassicaformis CCMP3155]|uniref:Metallo-beta-lactamase domain-containing protein n=2 Tax=Vitrella brassicaformis TaxID=1169539 RepID=A0A0G4F975_VITBC|nr:unnamed protein product [Vitrella brassicaformis CCMP3155]|eukprot:CEM09177.1 unnamed protein product [Vitrella brassicaformis CCMP3155]